MGTITDFLGDVTVFTYTRAEAIADGVLVEADPEIVQAAGFSIPVAMTSTVYETFVTARSHESESENLARLGWLLHTVRDAIKSSAEGNRVDFHHMDSDGKMHELYALCHPGDNGEPVITVMFIGED